MIGELQGIDQRGKVATLSIAILTKIAKSILAPQLLASASVWLQYSPRSNQAKLSQQNFPTRYCRYHETFINFNSASSSFEPMSAVL